jgi:hypothetical protein
MLALLVLTPIRTAPPQSSTAHRTGSSTVIPGVHASLMTCSNPTIPAQPSMMTSHPLLSSNSVRATSLRRRMT